MDHSPRTTSCVATAGSYWPPAPSWWATFAEATQDGCVPYLFKDVLPADFPGPDEIYSVIRTMQRSLDKRPRIRVYINEQRRDDLAKRLLDVKETNHTSIPQLMSDVVSHEKFSLILNDYQDWSEPTAIEVGRFLQSMYSSRGLPPGGAEQVVFAGNYAGTAFGVHRGFEHAFLIHLGPGKKDFHVWSEDLYQSLTGSLADKVTNYEHLLEHSTKYILEAGDIFYLPAKWFHLGAQDSYSVSVAVPLYDYPVTRWVKAALSNIADSLPFEGAPLPYLEQTFDENPFKELAESVLAKILKVDLPRLLDDHWYRRVSNGGFISEATDLCPALVVDEHSKLQLREPFKLCWFKDRQSRRLNVYLRNRAVWLQSHNELINFFRQLNNGGQVTMRDVIDGLAVDVPAGDVLEAFRELTKTGGLAVLQT